MATAGVEQLDLYFLSTEGMNCCGESDRTREPLYPLPQKEHGGNVATQTPPRQENAMKRRRGRKSQRSEGKKTNHFFLPFFASMPQNAEPDQRRASLGRDPRAGRPGESHPPSPPFGGGRGRPRVRGGEGGEG